MAPISKLNEPGRHEMHDWPPSSGWYFPSGHFMHVSLDVAAKTALDVPLGHFWHVELDDAPTRELYVPAEHGVHALAPSLDWK